VTDLELAAFVDGGLDAESRRRVEAHLLECDDCRGVVSGAGRTVVAVGRRSRRPLIWLSGIAAAAVLLMVMVPRSDQRMPGARTRETEAIGPAGFGFAAAAPPDGAVIRPDTLTFYWSAAGGGATYQITISTEAGAIVWSGETSDTSARLPAEIARGLQPGRAYYWQVDGVLPDLRSASTGPRRFLLPP